MAFLSSGVGVGFPGLGVCASFEKAGEVSARVACTFGDGAATLTVLQCMFANSRRHLREKCFATGFKTVQTDSFPTLTETRLSLLPRRRLGSVSHTHVYGKEDTNSSICLLLNSGGALTGGSFRRGTGGWNGFLCSTSRGIKEEVVAGEAAISPEPVLVAC